MSVHSLFHCTLNFYTAICQTEGFYTGLFLKMKVNGFHVLWQNTSIVFGEEIRKIWDHTLEIKFVDLKHRQCIGKHFFKGCILTELYPSCKMFSRQLT